MVFKKKQTTTRCKSKEQPHWKQLAILLSKKKQLNVLLRRELIQPAVASTSESNPSVQDPSHSELHNENLLVKRKVVTPEPALVLPTESNDQGSVSGIRPENCSPEFNITVEPTSSNDTDETYNVSINDFNSILEVATKDSDIRLSIENTYFNLNNTGDKTNTEHNDTESNYLQPKRFEQNNIVMIAEQQSGTSHKKTSQKRELQRLKKNEQKKYQSVVKNINQHITEINENKVQENNLPSKSILETSTIEKRREEHQYIPKIKISRERLRNKYEIQDELHDNVFNQNRERFTLIELEDKPKGKPVKRKIGVSVENNQDKGKEKQDQVEEKNEKNYAISTSKITKRSRGRHVKRNFQDKKRSPKALDIENQQTEMFSELNDYSNVVADKTTCFTLIELEDKPKEKLAKRKIGESVEQNQDKEKEKQDQEEKNEKDSATSTSKITKRLRGRPLKRNTQDKKSTPKALDIDCQQTVMFSELNVDDTYSNVVADKTTCADDIPINETGESERHTRDESQEDVMMDTEKKKTSRKPRSIAHELQLLRRRIIGLSQSQKQIQNALQSTKCDRFELFGRTIAECLRELPRLESQSLEIKLMDVLVEEKRNLMTVANYQPMCANYNNNGD